MPARPHRSPTTHRCPTGQWTLVCADPAPALRGDVLEYRGYVEARPLHGVWREASTTVVPLVVNLGPAFRIGLDGGPAESWGSFVAGPLDGFALVAPTGPSRCLQVDFTPLGAYRFLGLPMGALAGALVGLDDLLAGEAGTLAARLDDARDWRTRFALVDAFIARRFAQTRSPSPAVRRAWSRLVASDGRIRVADLARDLDWSRKHLVARFRAEIGQPPKTMARILRFERAGRMMAAGSAWADIAYACGYADQSHLVREFRALSGLPPSALARRRPAANGLVESG